MIELFLTEEEADLLRHLLEDSLGALGAEPPGNGAHRAAEPLARRALLEGLLRRLDIALPLRRNGG